MYSISSIEVLSSRIKWRTPIGEYASILIPEITADVYDKAYQDAHKLVTIENIHSTQPNSEISDSDFNIYLIRLNNVCVTRVLEDVFDTNTVIDDTKNYDSLIELKQNVFDVSLKLFMAVQVIQGMITSIRKNPEERTLKNSYNYLKVELDGAKNENGKVLSVGVGYLYRESIKEIREKLFPKKKNKVTVNFVNKW